MKGILRAICGLIFPRMAWPLTSARNVIHIVRLVMAIPAPWAAVLGQRAGHQDIRDRKPNLQGQGSPSLSPMGRFRAVRFLKTRLITPQHQFAVGSVRKQGGRTDTMWPRLGSASCRRSGF
jgi:hypothetical protein